MTLIDFIIGVTLMNALPHFVLGVWQQRMLSAFGFGDNANIAYGLLNFIISVGLFAYKYGIEGIMENGIYAGASTLLVIYFITSSFLRKIFTKRSSEA
jgi:hypothetical protein